MKTHGKKRGEEEEEQRWVGRDRIRDQETKIFSDERIQTKVHISNCRFSGIGTTQQDLARLADLPCSITVSGRRHLQNCLESPSAGPVAGYIPLDGPGNFMVGNKCFPCGPKSTEGTRHPLHYADNRI